MIVKIKRTVCFKYLQTGLRVSTHIKEFSKPKNLIMFFNLDLEARAKMTRLDLVFCEPCIYVFRAGSVL